MVVEIAVDKCYNLYAKNLTNTNTLLTTNLICPLKIKLIVCKRKTMCLLSTNNKGPQQKTNVFIH